MMVVRKAKLVKLEIDTGWRSRHVLMEKSVLVDDKNEPLPETMGGEWKYRYRGKKSATAISAAKNIFGLALSDFKSISGDTWYVGDSSDRVITFETVVISK